VPASCSMIPSDCRQRVGKQIWNHILLNGQALNACPLVRGNRPSVYLMKCRRPYTKYLSCNWRL
jgi:hypothetical protein